MEKIIPALALFFGITDEVTKPPVYETGNFYYYDKDHHAQGFQLTNKVVVYVGVDEDGKLLTLLPQRFLDASGGLPPRTWKILGDNRNGNILFTCENKEDTLKLLLEVIKEKLTCYPVIRWDGVECVPTDYISIKKKPFVTDAMLRRHLSENRSFQGIIALQDYDKGLYSVQIKQNSLPNIFVLANMLAEDTLWLESAKVMFDPLYLGINGYMYVTTSAIADLGEERVLHVVVDVCDPKIKIRKDLLPKLGDQTFMLLPLKDEAWYDFGTPKISEKVTSEKTTLTMEFPFRFLSIGTAGFTPMIIPYTDGNGISKTYSVPNIQFNIHSVITDTDINDIQPIRGEVSLSAIPITTDLPIPQPVWSKLGAGVFGLGVGLWGLALVVSFGKILSFYVRGDAGRKRRDVHWKALRRAATRLERPGYWSSTNWKEIYTEINTCLAAVLADVLDLRKPVSSDDVADEDLKLCLKELEKLYSNEQKVQPNIITDHLRRFMRVKK